MIFSFLSTPSARRATSRRASSWLCPSYFYPRPPRGGRRCRCSLVVVGELISIHALREEGDSLTSVLWGCSKISIHALREEGDCKLWAFLRYWYISIHALREEGDLRQRPEHLPLRISIHALREEGDGSTAATGTMRRYFYPRPPRGGRPLIHEIK